MIALMHISKSIKEGDSIDLNENKATCPKAEQRFENNGSLIESFLTFKVHKVDKEYNAVLHFYHTTQKILIQGTGAQAMWENIIVPHIEHIVKVKEKEIADENKLILSRSPCPTMTLTRRRDRKQTNLVRL